MLEFIPTPEGLDQVGGLQKLKKWIATRKAGLLPSAGEKPLDPPKGILLLGVQGCGKSLAAKAIASAWGLPLLALDSGKLLAPFIGESERNLRDALRRVERMAPCVLWIDEIEKAFASSRSIGIRRRGLQAADRNAARVDAGARLARLPGRDGQRGRRAAPRDDAQGPGGRGLLRGPAGPGGRAPEIFRLHLPRRGEDPARFDLAALARRPRPASPAPRSSRRSSRRSTRRGPGSFRLDPRAILVAVRSTRPLSVMRAEQIDALRRWAAGRCVPAGETDSADLPPA